MTNLFAKHEDDIRSMLTDYKGELDPTLVDITNVAYYVQMQEDDELNDAPQFLYKLPWNQCWFEFQEPKKVRRDGKIVKNPGAEDVITGIFAYPVSDHENMYKVFISPNNPINPSDEIGYVGSIILDYSDPNDTYSTLGLKRGQANRLETREEALKIKRFLDYHITNVLFATTFSHCNNVEYYDKSHPKSLQKANKKRGKIPQETYRVLDIGGLKKQAKSESNSSQGELSTALHICRGHFKTYTEEKPLFGKITGTVWCPPHQRGTIDQGKINKEYNIKTE